MGIYTHTAMCHAAVVLTEEQYAGVVGVMDMEKKRRILKEVRQRGAGMVSDKAANRFPVLSLMDGKVCVREPQSDRMHTMDSANASALLGLKL